MNANRLPARTGAGDVVLRAVDAAVERRWSAAVDRAAGATGETVDERIRHVCRSFASELGMVGAAAGGVAASPGVGTAAAVGAIAAELSVATTRQADLILTIAALHGHEEASVEERRAWILAVLVFGDGAANGLSSIAAETGKGLGKRATSAIPTSSLQKINRALGRQVVTKYGTKRGALAVGRLLPFGFGAAIGGSSNYVLVRALGRHTDRFFREMPGAIGDAA